MPTDVFPHADTFDGYGSEALEQALGIEFAPVSEPRLRHLHNRLGRIASWFGGNAPEIRTPQKGVLTQRLTPEQKKVLNAVLWSEYAEVYGAQQDALLRTPVEETRDRMVDLFDVLHQREAWFTYSQVPIHPACGPYANRERILWMRSDVAHSVASVFRALNDVNLMAHIEDCWRPPEVQEGLFIRRVIELARQNSDWSWERVKMIANSLTAPVPGFAGHQAGAAVDWLLRRKSDAVHPDPPFLETGTTYAEGGAVSCMRFPYLTYEQFRTRVLFLFSAEMGGFKTLPTETWHMSRGDRGMVGGTTVPVRRAIYGPIRNFDRRSGGVDPYESDLVDKRFLEDDEIQFLVEESRRGRAEGEGYHSSLEEILGVFRQRRRGR